MLIFQIIFVQLIVFAGIFLVIRHLMIKNTTSAVNRLKLADEQNEKKLKELRENIKIAEETYQKRLAEIAEDVKKQQEENKRKLEEEREKIMSQAKAEANSIVETARGRAKRIEREESDYLQNQALSLAQMTIFKLLSEKTRETFNEQIVDELLAEVESMDKSNILLQDNKVEAIGRYPLSAKQKNRLEEILKNKLSSDIEIKETIKKEMAGGLMLSAGSLLIDGSLECRLKEVIQKLQTQKEEGE